MKLKRIILIFSVTILVAYLLWPLGSDTFSIHFDEAKIKKKNAWLNGFIDPNKKDSLPNILCIVVDDLGMADLSLYGLGDIQTPNIDKIGKEGITFTNAFTTSPVCSPARAALLTGRYPQRFGFQFQMHDRYLKNRLEYLGFKYFIDSEPWEPKWMDEVPEKNDIERQGIPPSEILLPEILKTSGYQTGLIGKWHLGSSETQIPCKLGFDYQYGFYASHSLYIEENSKGYVGQKIEEDFTDQYIWSGQRNGPHAIYRNCEMVEEKSYLTDAFTREALHFIENRKDNPFFLLLSYNAPHTPLQAPEEYVDQFSHIKDPIKRVYYAMIKNLDDNIGKVMEYLSESGLDENTVIFFISDNGGAEYTLTTENGPYKGGKITDFEGGIRIPFAMRWNGHFPDEQIFEDQVSIMDIFHTSVALAKGKLPADIKFDGVNLMKFIDGPNDTPHQNLIWQRGASKAIRTEKWKLLWNEEKRDTLLFDLVSSEFENENVLIENPGIALELIDRHKAISSGFSKPIWPSMIYYKFPFEGKEVYFDQ